VRSPLIVESDVSSALAESGPREEGCGSERRAADGRLYVFALVHIVTGRLHHDTLEIPARTKEETGRSEMRRLQEAFVAHLREVTAAVGVTGGKLR
jgi:hypothetical protein